MTLITSCALAQAPQAAGPASDLYKQLQNTAAIEKIAQVNNVVIHRDRVTITFVSGTLFIPTPVAGEVRSAVFIGKGTLYAAPPPEKFEQENVYRMLHAENLSTDFKTAVLRFTDNPADILSQCSFHSDVGVVESHDLAANLEPSLLKETGINISGRQLESIMNGESPGIFLAQFDGGERGRFTYLFDPQTRIPTSNFGINAGEKGLIFAYNHDEFSNDVWMAFYSQQDYASGISPYADNYNLIGIKKYNLKLDLMEPKKVLGLTATLDMVARVDKLRTIPFEIGEELSTYNDERLKKQLHILAAHLADGTPLAFFQEPWESGFSIVLPQDVKAGQELSITLDLKGDFMMEPFGVSGTYFPINTETWYPRHGYLARSYFDITMLHRKKDRVGTIGELVKDGPAPNNKNVMITEFRTDYAVPLASFAVGPYEIHKATAMEADGKSLPIELYSVSPYVARGINPDLMLAEMNNSVRFFSSLFGEYPFPFFRAIFHPFNFGQGFATTIMIPGVDIATFYNYSFIAHETAHQWWGDMVLWRSYRDQWLSEGFAQYSAMLYVQLRSKPGSELEMIKNSRKTLLLPPATMRGIARGRLADVGPLIMGGRLETDRTRGAYSALTYDKGALVLRMVHFLFTDPQTGNGQPFFDMMRDFVQRFKWKTASTEDFFAVANEHLKDTPLAQKYGYKSLNWFFQQWVEGTGLPSYKLKYHIESDAKGPILKGDLLQEGLPDNANWFMPLPLVIHFPGDKIARGTIAAQGLHTAINIRLPQIPDKVELDPDMWILSARTTTEKE